MKLVNCFNVLFLFVLLLAFQSCEDEYKRVDYSKLMAEENEVLQNYLNHKVHYGDSEGELMTRLDSMTKAAIDTVDYYKDRGGIIFFNQKIGEGEPVVAGKLIGYRYKKYPIVIDSTGVAIKYVNKSASWPRTNFDNLDPAFGYAGQVNASVEYYTGINDAIMKMNCFGKSTVILPSSSGDNSFITYIYELEVVYIEK